MFNKPNDVIGVGINYRSEISADIIKHINDIACIEVYTEKFFIKDHDANFESILNAVPLILHGLDLSIGSSGEVSKQYLSELESVISRLDYLWFSEHISLTKEDNLEVGHLMPVQFSQEVADKIVNKAIQVQSISDKPFLLENITYYYQIPGSTMSEAEFINYILDKSDCGMLLDVNNLYINAINHQYDPIEFLKQLPLERVVEAHMAGGSRKYGMLIDTHANPIWPEVWKLLDYAVANTPLSCVIIERDSNLPHFSDLLDEVKIAKGILTKHGKF